MRRRERPFQTEVLAERGARVAVPEHTAALELGHHQADDVLVGAGRVRRSDDEAVAGAAVEPGLHLVGDVGAGADEARALQERGPVPRQVAQVTVSVPMCALMFCTSPRMPDTDPISSSVMGASRSSPEKS